MDFISARDWLDTEDEIVNEADVFSFLTELSVESGKYRAV